VKLPENLDPNRELLLRVHYIGDAARVYLGGRLLTSAMTASDTTPAPPTNTLYVRRRDSHHRSRVQGVRR